MTSQTRMRVVLVAVLLLAAGCTSAGPIGCQCPKPVAYDETTLDEISRALRALPAANVLHRAMEDYENERDDLRFCPPP
jgi:hypothetical protein